MDVDQIIEQFQAQVADGTIDKGDMTNLVKQALDRAAEIHIMALDHYDSQPDRNKKALTLVADAVEDMIPEVHGRCFSLL